MPFRTEKTLSQNALEGNIERKIETIFLMKKFEKINEILKIWHFYGTMKNMAFAIF
jgi:hypothetical protein